MDVRDDNYKRKVLCFMKDFVLFGAYSQSMYFM